jgi:predicted nucleic acid-binding Zn ribbon protein
MPIYNFECKKCKFKTSRIMTYKEKKLLRDPRACPKCFRGTEVEYTLYSTVGRSNFVLKGKGWYKDGY